MFTLFAENRASENRTSEKVKAKLESIDHLKRCGTWYQVHVNSSLARINSWINGTVFTNIDLKQISFLHFGSQTALMPPRSISLWALIREKVNESKFNWLQSREVLSMEKLGLDYNWESGIEIYQSNGLSQTVYVSAHSKQPVKNANLSFFY